tara:strand:+ start:862 stop:1326 length:465 start_codon:yes stop_codon:yes gene_type:complete
MRDVAIRIVNKQLAISDMSDCVIFDGPGSAKGGYGRINVSSNGSVRSFAAHRIAYEIHNGTLEKGLIVRHTCHNPRCINPKHLKCGTHKQNAEDRARAGRSASQKGAKNGNAKTTEEDRANIRRRRLSGETLKSIAKDYGVHFSTVSAIMKSGN